MTKMQPEYILDRTPPTVVITQVGRFTYSVSVKHGLTQWGPGGMPWIVIGRKRAERKARKELARYVRARVLKKEREAAKVVISS